MRIATVGLLAPLIVSFLSLSSVAAEGVDLSLHIPGEAPLYNTQGFPVLIAGIWHELSLGLTSPVEGSLQIEASYNGPSGQGLSSHYVWVRDAVGDRWSDPLYGTFVDSELSRSEALQITFRLGVDAVAQPGIWTLEFTKDEASLRIESIEVRKAELGFGLSTADFNFRAMPFQPTHVSSEELGQYLRVLNLGNVPLRLSVSFDRLANRLSLLNPSEVVHVQGDARYFLALNLNPRPPQVLDVRGVSRVEMLYLIPSSGSSQLVPVVEGDFSLRVVVGRSGYAVEPIGGVIFQTIQSLNAAFGSLVAWNVYLTGTEPVSFNVEVSGARLVGVFSGETLLVLPALLTPPSNGELALTLQVMTDLPSTVAEVLITLEGQNTGEIRTFRTSIVVGPKAPAPSLLAAYLWPIVAAMTATVLAFVSYNHLRFAAGQRGGGRPQARTEVPKESAKTAKQAPKSDKAKNATSRFRPETTKSKGDKKNGDAKKRKRKGGN